MRTRLPVIASALVVLTGVLTPAADAAPSSARTIRTSAAPVLLAARAIVWIAGGIVDVGEEFVVATSLIDDQGGSAFNWFSSEGPQVSVQLLSQNLSWRLPVAPPALLGRAVLDRLAWGNGSWVDREVRAAWAFFGVDGTCTTSVGPEPSFPSDGGGDVGLAVDPNRAQLAFLTDAPATLAVRVAPHGGLTTGGTIVSAADGWFSALVDMTNPYGEGGRIVATGPDGSTVEARGALAVSEPDSHGSWRFDVSGPQLWPGPLLVSMDVPDV